MEKDGPYYEGFFTKSENEVSLKWISPPETVRHSVSMKDVKQIIDSLTRRNAAYLVLDGEIGGGSLAYLSRCCIDTRERIRWRR